MEKSIQLFPDPLIISLLSCIGDYTYVYQYGIDMKNVSNVVTKSRNTWFAK